MARYTLKRPVCAITSGSQMSHPARPDKAGRRSLQSQLAAAIKMTHRAANQRLRRSRLVCIPSWNGGLEMIISKRLLPRKRRCWQRLHLQYRWRQRRAAGFNCWRRDIAQGETNFGEWRAKATESTPAPQPTSRLYLSCAELTSRAATGYRHPAVAAKHARQRFDRQAIDAVFPQNLSASNTGCFSRRPK